MTESKAMKSQPTFVFKYFFNSHFDRGVTFVPTKIASLFREILEPDVDYLLTCYDLAKEPERAIKANILVTPALIVENEGEKRKITCDLQILPTLLKSIRQLEKTRKYKAKSQDYYAYRGKRNED